MKILIRSSNEVEDGLVIRCHCLAHGRRQFSDLEDVFPMECRVVLDALKQVFDHDEEAQDQQMSPQARLAYHQEYSQPLMDELKAWLARQLEDRLVEPNSSLGQSIAYMQTYWETLTRFLQIAGAPLGRVDDWRGLRRLPVAIAAPFGDDASVRLALAPFPAAARRTGRADFPHPALIQNLTSSRSTGFCSARAA